MTPVALALALASPRPAATHPLAEGTARITLRDQHLDIAAEWDLFPLVDASPTEVATCDDARLAAIHAHLRRRVEAETELRVNGVASPLSLTQGPSVGELRAIAAQLSSQGQPHGARVRLRLESPRAAPDARDVSLRAPSALGPVVVSFVQPSSRYVRPGGVAEFDVLRPPRGAAPTASRPAPRTDAPPSTTATTVVASFLAVVAGIAVGRRGRSPEGA